MNGQEPRPRPFSSRDGLMMAAGVLMALLALYLWSARGRGDEESGQKADAALDAGSEAASNEVTVPSDVLAAADIESEPVSVGAARERLQTTGVVEPDQRQIQEITPLVSGRVEQVSVALGDFVRDGAALLTLASPQIAELQGTLASARAKLVEAEAAFTRTTRLVELGAGAGKDQVAAEAEYKAAMASVTQAQQSLRALGSAAADSGRASLPTALVAIRAPMSGQVIARTVNTGAWIEAGKSVLTIANLAEVWVIASVPEARLGMIRVGAPVEISGPALGTSPLRGRVNYVDPQLNRETRTASVRIEAPNPNQALKIGMFVNVVMEGSGTPAGSELTIPATAVQRIGERTVVFVPTDSRERFGIRDVELGDEVGNAHVVRHGLAAGDRVVTRGGFTLKSQHLKGQFGEDEEIGPRKK